MVEYVVADVFNLNIFCGCLCGTEIVDVIPLGAPPTLWQ